MRTSSQESGISNLGYVSQDPYIINATIYESVAFFRNEITREKAYKAIQLAYAEDFVSELPRQLDTQIGEG